VGLLRRPPCHGVGENPDPTQRILARLSYACAQRHYRVGDLPLNYAGQGPRFPIKQPTITALSASLLGATGCCCFTYLAGAAPAPSRPACWLGASGGWAAC